MQIDGFEGDRKGQHVFILGVLAIFRDPRCNGVRISRRTARAIAAAAGEKSLAEASAWVSVSRC